MRDPFALPGVHNPPGRLQCEIINRERKVNVHNLKDIGEPPSGEDSLCEAEVLATSGHGGIERLLERFVVIVLWEIELWYHVSECAKYRKRR